jgi:hypothetical protein
MAVSDNLEKFNEFLKSQTGVTEELLDELFSDTPNFSPIFFSPMNTFESLKKCYSPISAPIALGIISVEFLLDTVIYLLQGIYNLIVNRNFEDFQKSMELSLKSLIFTAAMVAATVASPFINIVDLVGSLFTTAIGLLCKKNENTEHTIRI